MHPFAVLKPENWIDSLLLKQKGYNLFFQFRHEPLTTKTGLTIKAVLDENEYETGIKVPDQELATVKLDKESFHGELNYYITPSNNF